MSFIWQPSDTCWRRVACGGLLGKQDGRTVEIFNSFEIIVEPELDEAFFTQHLESSSSSFSAYSYGCCLCLSYLLCLEMLPPLPPLYLPLYLPLSRPGLSSSAVQRVFKTLEFVGWYSTGSAPTPELLQLHRTVLPRRAAALCFG